MLEHAYCSKCLFIDNDLINDFHIKQPVNEIMFTDLYVLNISWQKSCSCIKLKVLNSRKSETTSSTRISTGI